MWGKNRLGSGDHLGGMDVHVLGIKWWYLFWVGLVLHVLEHLSGYVDLLVIKFLDNWR